ncbi:MAG: hypothetical protein JO172_13460 [Hyphomicrobiales bacterium]|nr:hypothetical protein [Hyphomicrobiales bacterium]
MILRKIPITDIDLDEFERKLREFESSSPTISAVGASEYPRAEIAPRSGAKKSKNPKRSREKPRDPPMAASSVHPRHKPMRGARKTADIDDVERQLREVASSVLRKSLSPSETGDLIVGRDKRASGTFGRRINADTKAAGATSQLNRGQMVRWRAAIHLKTYSERSVISRCARSLALPLLLLSLGAGALVVLSPEGALTEIDPSLKNARTTEVGRDDHRPSQVEIATAASLDQSSSSSSMPTEQSAPAIASSVASPSGEAGPTQPPASPGDTPSPRAISPSETPSVEAHDGADVIPVGVVGDDQRQFPSPLEPAISPPSPTKQLLDVDAAPASPSPPQAEVLPTTPSLDVVVASRSGALQGEAMSEAPALDMAALPTPQALTSLSTIAPRQTPDGPPLPSPGIESNRASPGSSDDAVSAAPALAALSTAEVLTSLPAATPPSTSDEVPSPSPGIESNNSSPGSGDDVVSAAPDLAALASAEVSTSLPTATPPPASDEAPSPPLAVAKAHPTDEVVETPAQLMADQASQSVPAIMASPVSDNDAIAEIVESIPKPEATGSQIPAIAAHSADSRPQSNNEPFSEASAATFETSTALPPVVPSPSTNVLSSSQAENIASDETTHSRSTSVGEAAFEAATLLATRQAPARLPPEAFAQATPATAVEPAKPPAAQLFVAQGSIGAPGAALPLPLSLNSAPAGAMIVIHGIAAGSTLTVGRALGAGDWQVTAGELHDAALRPPQGFAGAMELEVELRLFDDSVADRKTLHLEWLSSAAAQPTRPAFVVRHLDPDELAALLKRGEAFIANGDLASARLVLQRAAEAGEAQAALSLAGTFDPIVLDRLGLQGQKADIEKARTWYQRAQQLGSTTAPRRLQLLAGYDQ